MPHPEKEKVDMAWSCPQDEQQPACKNCASLEARRKQKKRQAAARKVQDKSSEILCEPYVPHGMKTISK